MAQPVFPLGHAAGKKHRQGDHGPPVGRADVLDVAPGMGLGPGSAVWFARGRARKSRGCGVEHRDNDGASRSPSGEFELVIRIEVMTEEMHGSDQAFRT